MSLLTDSIDSLVADKWPAVVAAQVNHAAGANRFCQLLPTSDEIPQNGNAVSPNKLSRKAGGESKSWQDFPGLLPSSLRSRLECHVYDGPSGKGFVLMICVQEGNETKRRLWNYGPETHRNVGWVVIKTEEAQ